MEKIDNFSETAIKIQKILWKILEPNFIIKNDLYLNVLLTHWTGKIQHVDLKQELDEIFCRWIIAATNSWSEKKNLPSTPVLTFALNVGCHLSAIEFFFKRMKHENLHEKLAEIVEKSEDLDTGVTVGFIALLSLVLEHQSGVQWLLTTSYWEKVVSIALKDHTNKYIKRKAYQFIIKILETAILLDKDFCEELVEILVQPLNVAAAEVELTNGLEVENINMYESLKPTLDLVSEVTDTLLKKFNKNILNIFLEMETPEAVQRIINFSRIQDFSFDLLKIRFIFLFYHLCGKLEGTKRAAHDADTLFDIAIMFDLIKEEIEKDHVRCVLKICYYAHVLYCNLDTRVPLCIRKGESIEFQNQMILFQLVPVMVFDVHQLLYGFESKKLVLSDELRQHFYLKLTKISAIKTLEITFRWENRIANKVDLIQDVTVGLQYIQKSKKIINRKQAAIIFELLIYTLKDLEHHLVKREEKSVPLEGMNYLNIVIDLIIDLVESFDLTWKDSIEIISVLDLSCAALQYDYVTIQSVTDSSKVSLLFHIPTLCNFQNICSEIRLEEYSYKSERDSMSDPKHSSPLISEQMFLKLHDEMTVKYLQLLNIAILRCMSPNMVLLMVNTNDTITSQIGSLLYSKCHHRTYQVRNKALEVVRTLALYSSSKFPEFANLLCNAELPQSVVNIAIHGNVSEEREIAIKCLRALILVEDICEMFQYDDNFWNNILNIVISDPKGAVRTEAAGLVSDLYKFDRCPDEILPRLYDVMTHAALADRNWEVKHKAVYFWARTIENYLTAQGMIDKMFPTHTFSKEKRKIVSLTKEEIRKRVIKVFNQISDIGAIYVLTMATQDEFDKEVSNLAKTFASKLGALFIRRKITSTDVDFKQPISPADSGLPSSPASPASESNQTYNEGHCISETLKSQYSSSCQYSSDLMVSYSQQDTPEEAKFSPSSYTAFTEPNDLNSRYSDISSPESVKKVKKEFNTNPFKEEVEDYKFFETADIGNDIITPESDFDLERALEENMEIPICSDMAETGQLFDELLKLDDDTLLEEICNTGSQAKTSKIKTRQYFPPSEYVKLCIELAETTEKKSIQPKQDLDEFDLLLNELLKEYDLDLTN